jgi:hypothetical protein
VDKNAIWDEDEIQQAPPAPSVFDDPNDKRERPK